MQNKFGLLGRKLGHSWSPQIHAMLAGYEYRLYQVEPEDLARFLTETPLAGMNVTIPYKKDVAPFCASLSDAARRIGSVNTLLRTPAGWYGDNTDYAGFRYIVETSGVDVCGKKTLVFGTGGASLAVKAALADMGAEPVVSVSRTGPENYGNLYRHRDARVLVNTTPLGMYPETGAAPVPVGDFPQCEGHFADQAIPREKVEYIMSTLSRQMSNLILIGMPGCGKSAVGQALAAALDRPFIDADTELEREAGMTIPDIFAKEGEEGFRARETAVLARLGMGSGAVIATGGGCVTRRENYPLLHQNGTIVWLRRDLAKLPTAGRPLSQANSLETLYARRKDQYAAFADLQADNNGTVEATVQAIRKAIS